VPRPSVPDRLLISALHGTAWRRATERGLIADAVIELHGIAQGRADLLAEAAGITAGAWTVRASTSVGTELLTAGLLLYAGADLRQLPGWIELGRRRATLSWGPVHG
jgi:hypothetical protein